MNATRRLSDRYLQIVIFRHSRHPQERFASNMKIIYANCLSTLSARRCPVASIIRLAYVHCNKPDSSNALSDNSRSGKMRRFLASIHKCQTIRKTGPPSSVHTSNYASTRTPPSPRAEYNKWKCPSLPARILLPVCLCFQHLLSNLSLFAARVICRRFGLHKVVNSRGAARI